MDHFIGRRIGDFELVSKLGEGGMGTVFLGVNSAIEQRAAVKILRPQIASQPQWSTRLLQEARAANRAAHPGIVKIFAVGHLDDGTAFICMEYLDGVPLSARQNDLTLTEALRLGGQIAAALAAAHACEVVHRDLKPANVMLIEDVAVPGGQRVKVLDFGIAKVAPAPGAETTALRTQPDAQPIGTPAYMAPEQITAVGTVTERSDVYALGIILYELVARRHPFAAVAGTAYGMLQAQVEAPPPSLLQHAQATPLWLAEMVKRMLSKDPAARPTMAEVAAILQAPPSLRPFRDVLTLASVGLVVLMLLAAWSIVRLRHPLPLSAPALVLLPAPKPSPDLPKPPPGASAPSQPAELARSPEPTQSVGSRSYPRRQGTKVKLPSLDTSQAELPLRDAKKPAVSPPETKPPPKPSDAVHEKTKVEIKF